MADPLPTTFPPTPSEPNYGIQDVLTIDGKTYILQGVSPSDQKKAIPIQDQYDSKIGERLIDVESTGSITAIGPAVTPATGQLCRFPLAVGSALTFRGVRVSIDGIAEAGTYNGLTVWTLTISRSKNWPKTDSVMPDVPVSTAASLPITVSPEPTEPPDPEEQ